MSSASLNQIVNQSAPGLWLVVVASALAGVGLVAVTSASMDAAALQLNAPYFYAFRHLIYLLVGLLCAFLAYQMPMSAWQKMSGLLLVITFSLLLLVLVPGVGKTVNGSTRWIDLGFFTVQVSEIAKLFALIYLAAYLARRNEEVRHTFWGIIKPLSLLSVLVLLLLKQPDFGAAVVIMSSALVMIFLAGARYRDVLVLSVLFATAAAAMILSSDYRMQRILSYSDPWADQFSSGYQLVQSLIAFGRGEWFGVGLGNSIQKLFYLPEAHTDFIFSIIAEEFGFAGNLLVIIGFVLLVMKMFSIGRRAEMVGLVFNAYVVYGFAMILGLQAMINIGVASGFLPTKGLTLPLISYGGNSLIIVCVMLALTLRANEETKQLLLAEEEKKHPRQRRRPARKNVAKASKGRAA